MRNNTPLPPKLFLRLFRTYCDPKVHDYIEGDLLEMYHRRLKQSGKGIADFRFVVDVLLLFRPGIFKSRAGYTKSTNQFGMYKSYFTVGWRNLLLHKGYSLINIGGLALGMSVAILNGLSIWHEFSYNKYFGNYDRIAMVAESGIDRENGGHWLGTTLTYPLATELMDNHGEHFTHIVRTSWDSNCILSSEETAISLSGLYADASAPEMFTFKMIKGGRTALRHPNTIMISASAAKALFGSDDVINRTLRLNNQSDVTIGGVYEDFPDNTRFYEKKFFAPWSLFLSENKWIERRALTDLRNHFIKIYVQIREDLSFEKVASQIKSALKFDPVDAEKASEQNKQLTLYPMRQWHLYPPPDSRRQGGYDPMMMITLVAVVGVFVLMLACINFMNLSTARSERRAKEVGIRKTIGSIRGQLITQFFSESLLIVCFAFLLALVFTSSFLPVFNDIATKSIAIPWNESWFWICCFVFILVTSLLAGSYPALYLSSFNPVKALKGSFRAGRSAALPRKVLVVVQFSISVILVIGTAIVHQQIEHGRNRPVGYDREGLIMVRKSTGDFFGKYETLRTELKNTGAVFEVSESMGPVTEVVSGNNGWDWKGRDPSLDASFATLSVSHLHGKTVGWQFLAGRDFDLTMANDSLGLVINESAAKLMNLESAIGEPVTWTWWADESRVLNYKIIGIIKDMVMDSPYGTIEPTIFYLKGFNGVPDWINVKINPEYSAAEAVSRIESVFKKVVPSVPFEYKFADEEYARKFGKEERLGKLASIFAVLAICISCLGLLGLASFVAEQRTKEIGIRKVLGATITNLWQMLSREFVILVIISCIIATPVAWFLFDNWLQKFEYRVNISPWIILLSAGGACLVTGLTVSYQTIKAALLNPANSLKSE